MPSGLVVHIVSGDNTHTEVLTHDLIRIGPGEECDLRLRASDLAQSAAASGTILELARSNGSYRVARFSAEVQIIFNGGPITANLKIRDGDEVQIGPSNLTLQFFPIRSLPAVIPSYRDGQVAPFVEQAAIDSAVTARRDDAKVFLREFTRELVREIKLSTKLITLAIALALVGGILYVGFAMV